MKPAILYIHGFASTGTSAKVDSLRAEFPEHILYAPNLTHNPLRDYEMLSFMMRTLPIGSVIGSSLGGFYALRLAIDYEPNIVLINPSIKPYETLADQVGTVRSHDGTGYFEWGQKELDELRILAIPIDPITANAQEAEASCKLGVVSWSHTLTLLGERDNRIDLDYTKRILTNSKIVVDPVADHRFADLALHFPAIKEMVNKTEFNGDCIPCID